MFVKHLFCAEVTDFSTRYTDHYEEWFDSFPAALAWLRSLTEGLPRCSYEVARVPMYSSEEDCTGDPVEVGDLFYTIEEYHDGAIFCTDDYSDDTSERPLAGGEFVKHRFCAEFSSKSPDACAEAWFGTFADALSWAKSRSSGMSRCTYVVRKVPMYAEKPDFAETAESDGLYYSIEEYYSGAIYSTDIYAGEMMEEESRCLTAAANPQ